MSAQAVPCEVPAIKLNIVSGWNEPVRRSPPHYGQPRSMPVDRLSSGRWPEVLFGEMIRQSLRSPFSGSLPVCRPTAQNVRNSPQYAAQAIITPTHGSNLWHKTRPV
jgi:hypothetical protein